MQINLMVQIKKIIYRLPSFLCIMIIQGIRPLLGPADCKFPVTCTRYAIQQLQEQPLHRAFYLIAHRLLSCNPFC